MPRKFLKLEQTGEVHPNSRKAAQIQRGTLRSQKINSQKTDRLKERIYPLLDRFSWFQLILEDDRALSEAAIHDLIALYLARFDEEVAKLKGEHRAGRPLPKRLDEIEMVRQAELREYQQSGFQLPELRTDAAVRNLRQWDGSMNSLKSLKLMKIRQSK